MRYLESSKLVNGRTLRSLAVAPVAVAALMATTPAAFANCGSTAAPYCRSYQPAPVRVSPPVLVPVGQVLYQPSVVYTRAPAPGLTYAAPNVRLAGPPIHRPDVHRGVTYVEPAPIVRAQYIRVQPAPVRPVMAAPQPAPMTVHRPVPVATPPRAEPLSIVRVTPPAPALPAPTPTYCYADSAKRYDSLGRQVYTGCNR